MTYRPGERFDGSPNRDLWLCAACAAEMRRDSAKN
jgi:hypothetical protein